MRVFGLAVLCLLLGSMCRAQKARVIFYSDAYGVKSTMEGVVAPVSRQPFPGWLYEGEEKLVPFRAGRFVVLDFEPGVHVFSANHTSEQSSPSVLSLNLTANSTICVRLSAATVNWYVLGIQTYHGRIEEVPCEAAGREVEKLKALSTKKMPKAGLEKLDPVQKAPAEKAE
jgi:hypothetical protein